MDLTKHNLEGADLSRTKLKATKLPLNLKDCDLTLCDLSGMDLSKHNLEGANLSATNLTNTQLPYNLKNCLLHDCDLSGMDLSKHNLEGASFASAKLQNTKLPLNLKDCNLTLCDLSDKDLSQHNLTSVNLEAITYNEKTKFPLLENIEQGILVNLLRLTIDADQYHKQFGYDLLERELGSDSEKTKNKISSKILQTLKDKPSQILETLYFLRLNNSQKHHKLSLNLKKNALKAGLDDFSLAILRNIFSGDSKQMILKKYKGIKASLENMELILPLKEFLLKAKPENLDSFLEEVYNFSNYKDLNPDIVSKATYKNLANSLISSEIPSLAESEEHAQQSKITTTKLQDEILSKLNKFSKFLKTELVKKVVDEYSISEETSNNFLNTAKLENIEHLLNAFAYREKVHIKGPERKLIDQIINNYIQKKTNDFILQALDQFWLKELKSYNPNFDPQKLRQEFTRDYHNGLKLSVVTNPVEYFSMSSSELSDFSCLGIEGANKDKVLNHALNAHTSLIIIEKEDSKLARLLVSLNDNGDLNIYPLYRFDDSVKNEDIKAPLEDFLKEYKKFLGLSPDRQGPEIDEKPISMFNIPSYYDATIAVL